MGGRAMTLQEKLATRARAFELRDAGKGAEALALEKTIPVSPFLAKIIQEKAGADFLVRNNWNLQEAEAEFGPGWLTHRPTDQC